MPYLLQKCFVKAFDPSNFAALEVGPKQGHLSFEMYRGPIEMRTMRRPLVLKSVLFDTGKSDLRDESKQELDSLASLLNNDWNPIIG